MLDQSLHMKKNESISPMWPRTGVLDQRQGGGGGGYSHFFFIRRLGPSIYRSAPKNIRNFKHPNFRKKAQLNGNRKSTSNGKYVVNTDIYENKFSADLIKISQEISSHDK